MPTVISPRIILACFLFSDAILCALDLNHDALDDVWAARYGVAAFSGEEDPDLDGKRNLIESLQWTDPYTWDDKSMAGLISDFSGDELGDSWQALYQITAADLLADPDNDLRTNWEESVVASNPRVADQPWRRAPEGTPAAVGPASFTLGLPHTVPAWRYTLLWSTDLMNWEPAEEVDSFWGDGASHSVTANTSGATRMFFRWRLDNPDDDLDGLSLWHENLLGTSDEGWATGSTVGGGTGTPPPGEHAPGMDSDGDDYADAVELRHGYDPADPDSSPLFSGQQVQMKAMRVFGSAFAEIYQTQLHPARWRSVEAWNLGSDGDLEEKFDLSVKPVLPELRPIPNIAPTVEDEYGNFVLPWDDSSVPYEYWGPFYGIAEAAAGEGSSYGTHDYRWWMAQWIRFRMETDIPSLRPIRQHYVLTQVSRPLQNQEIPLGRILFTDDEGEAEEIEAGPREMLTLEIPADGYYSADLARSVTATPGQKNTARAYPLVIEQLSETSTGDPGPMTENQPLRFSRWWSAYPQQAPFTLDKNFIATDLDRFVIRVPKQLGTSPDGTLTVKLATKAPAGMTDGATYSDDATEITLRENGMYLISPPMILVTNAEDDDDAVTGLAGVVSGSTTPKADNQPDDPTHIGWMGGTVEITLPGVTGAKAVFDIAPPKNMVTVQTAIVNASGDASPAGVTTALVDIKRETKELFAQEHIEVKFQGEPVITPFDNQSKMWKASYANYFEPEKDEEDYRLFLFKTGATGTTVLTDEAFFALKEVADTVSWQKDAVRLVFAPFKKTRTYLFNVAENQFEDDETEIGAYTLNGLPGFNYQGHQGTIIVNSNHDNLTSRDEMRMIAHELAHVLMGHPGHATPGLPLDTLVPPGDPAYPWHRLLFQKSNNLPLEMKRFSKQEHQNIFRISSRPFLKSYKK